MLAFTLVSSQYLLSLCATAMLINCNKRNEKMLCNGPWPLKLGCHTIQMHKLWQSGPNPARRDFVCPIIGHIKSRLAELGPDCQSLCIWMVWQPSFKGHGPLHNIFSFLFNLRLIIVKPTAICHVCEILSFA